MKNPFKVGDKVLTKVRGAEVEAVVTKLWQNEVQVHTPDNELRWRTVYTVWYPGAPPLIREQKTAKSVGIAVGANNRAAKPAAAKAKKTVRKQARKRR